MSNKILEKSFIALEYVTAEREIFISKYTEINENQNHGKA